jgi:hypothetical protein
MSCDPKLHPLGRPRRNPPEAKQKRLKVEKDGRSKARLGPAPTRIINGEEDVSAWSNENLWNYFGTGKIKGAGGRGSDIIPRQVAEEIMRRWIQPGDNYLKSLVAPAVAWIEASIRGELPSDAARSADAWKVIERAFGKTPDRVQIESKELDDYAPWEIHIAELFADMGPEDREAYMNRRMNTTAFDGKYTPLVKVVGSDEGAVIRRGRKPTVSENGDGRRKGRRVRREATQPEADSPVDDFQGMPTYSREEARLGYNE